MKLGITRFVMAAAIVALMVVAGSTVARAQCTASPSYYPDFTTTGTENQNCLTLNAPSPNPYPGYPGFYPVVTPPTPPPVVATVLRLTPNEFFTAGSAWYNTPQPVAGPFSTTFTFELTGFNGSGPADGIAFVIQNSALTALGPDGCGIGFGGDSQIGCTSNTGIPDSLAIEFNTYKNAGIDPSNSDVAIQSCPSMAANSVDPSCRIAVNDLTLLDPPINLADGNTHMVTITYTPSTLMTCPPPTGTGNCSSLDVLLDSTDLFPGGVLVNLSTLLTLTNGNAYVGFTAATGGGDDNQDILSWTFMPNAQSQVVTANALTTFNFQNSIYNFTAEQTPTDPPVIVQVTPMTMTASACNALVQRNFWPARCFVYESSTSSGGDAPVMFSVTCPQLLNGTCTPFYAELGTNAQIKTADNPLFIYPGILGPLNPFPGVLKGGSGNPAPCTVPASGPLFQSNQIDAFSDGLHTTAPSGGTGSCWVATYLTPGETPPGITISSPTSAPTYPANTTEPASYTCGNPITSQAAGSPIGPYLTVSSCKQSTGTQTHCTFTPTAGPGGNPGGLVCTGTFVTPKNKGSYIFAVTAIDSGGNQNVNAVIYNVK